MLSYFNQWGSLGPLMVKAVSTLHGDTRCVRTISYFKCILNLEFWESCDLVWISSTMFINVKYSITLFTVVWLLFHFCVSSCFILLDASLYLPSVCVLCSLLYILNSLLMLLIGWIWCIGGVVRSWASSWFWCFLELQYWVLSVLLNPSLSWGVLHWRSMLSWSKVMYGCIQYLLRDRLLALGGVLTAFHAFYL